MVIPTSLDSLLIDQDNHRRESDFSPENYPQAADPKPDPNPGPKKCTKTHDARLCPQKGGTCKLLEGQYPHLCDACGLAFG
jgi:hypothetical protein